MKRVLYIIGALDSGGVAKSIVNLLNAIDRKEKEVHLMVMGADDGPFARYIPNDVIIHRNPISAWLLSGFGGVWQLVKHGHLLLALGSLLRMVLSKIDKPSAAWLLAQMIPPLNSTQPSQLPSTPTSTPLNSRQLPSTPQWDTIVDYNGQQDLYYMIDKLKSKRKITFFHSDYHKWSYYERMDRKYFPKVDAICTISEQCVQSLKEVFPEVADKIKLVPNVSLAEMIYKLAAEPVEMPPLHGVVLATVGHVSFNKGIDLIIGAAKILKQKGVDFSWILVGSTDAAEGYVDEIMQSDLKDNFFFVGVQSNPYAYMQRADIIVHPSRFEGKSITLDEAKILCKPIVVTNFSTVFDQFENGVNAAICEMDACCLVDALINLVRDKSMRERYVSQLRKELQKNKVNLLDF